MRPQRVQLGVAEAYLRGSRTKSTLRCSKASRLDLNALEPHQH